MDLYSKITDQIVTQLEAGTRPWHCPWTGSNPTQPLRSTGQPYQGINVLLLWGAACANGFSGNHWFTYKQAQELGGQVRKGEKSSLVVFASSFNRTEQVDGKDVEHKIPFLKSYCVFNADQVDGLPERFHNKPTAILPVEQRIAAADAFIQRTGATIGHGGSRAYYRPSTDSIQLPDFAAFHDAESYYATALHELTHWTGHEKRCNRDWGKRFGDEAYAFEELVAELGAAFLCASLGIALEPREDHAAYLGHWLKVLKQDKRAIFTAASHAQKAADFTQALQQQAAA